MRFDYAKSFSGRTVALSHTDFVDLINSEKLRGLCMDIQAALAASESGTRCREYGQLKKQLPVVCWQSHFDPAVRKDANATHSGLYMLDIDHIEPVRMGEIVENAMKEGLDKLGVYIIHKTPSERGLRFVAKCLKANEALKTLVEHQWWLAQQIGVTEDEFDSACKDWARCSFLPANNYFIFINPAIFTDDAEIQLDTHAKGNAESIGLGAAHTAKQEEVAREAAPHEGDNEGEPEYKGIAISTIAREYFERTGGMPVDGERHQRGLDAARVLRYICDFNSNVLFKVLKPYAHHEDVDGKDMKRLCEDACTSMNKGSKKPAILEQIISDLTTEKDREEEAPLRVTPPTMPKKLPPIFHEWVKRAPEDFKEASFTALLPVLGTIFSPLRATYLSGKRVSPSFMAVVEAPQASGKDFLRDIVDTMMVHVDAEDAINWGIWQKYLEDKQRCKNKDEQPEKPKIEIRNVPATISITQYLTRQSNCPDKHLFSFCPEIATMLKSNKSGAWAEKSDLYRLAFDNAKFGQDYASDNSFSGVVRVFYNWLVSGTPMDVKRFFANCEDGLNSRVVFCILPDQLGAKMPKWGSIDAKAMTAIQKLVKPLEREQGYDLSYTFDALEKWLEAKRQLVLATADRALDVYRRRSAQIGFQVALLCHHIYLKSSTAKVPKITAAQQRNVVEVVLYAADLALYGQYTKFAEDVNDLDAKLAASKQKKGKALPVFNELPDSFYNDDLRAALAKAGLKYQPKTLIWVWSKNKLIKKVEDHYEKI